MERLVIYHPMIKQDVDEATGYYGDVSVALLANFDLELENAVQYLIENPLHQQCIFEEVRKMNLRKFPYAVFYEVSDEFIFISAITHLRRHPNVWQTRK